MCTTSTDVSPVLGRERRSNIARGRDDFVVYAGEDDFGLLARVSEYLVEDLSQKTGICGRRAAGRLAVVG